MTNCLIRRAAAALLLLAAGYVQGCIENDIPYPVIECTIESIDAEGLAGAPEFDYAARRITLPLLETTDIQNVRITSAPVTEGALLSQPIVGHHDLREPLSVTLSLYQEYTWTIEASQTIPRIFTVEGQVGATEWDPEEYSARVWVGFDDLSSVRITALKLGPEGISSMSCTDVADFNESNLDLLRDFRTPRRIVVSFHGRSEMWYLTVAHTDLKVNFDRIDAWTRTAWLYASGLSGTEMGFRYRAAGTEVWTTVPETELTVDGGAFRTRIRGLEPECEYEVVAYSGADESAVERFTTEAELPLPNGGFEEWSKPGNILYPYLSADAAFWDTGNKGSAAVNETISENSTDVRPGSPGRYSAALTSKYANLAGIGKFAAGNIFVGTYAETIGTNGKVNFGRPFTGRPVALRGWIKYTQGEVDRIGEQPQGMTLEYGDPDQGSIYIAVGNWTAEEYGGTAESPVQIYTREKSTFFNSAAPAVIGYGEWMLTESIDQWQEFVIPLDYRATDVVPTHLIIVCSSSRWGDYFTGSTRSRMWLDDFELVWE